MPDNLQPRPSVMHLRLECKNAKGFDTPLFWAQDNTGRWRHKLRQRRKDNRDTLLPTHQSDIRQSIQLAKLVICGAPLWLNQPDSLTSKSCFGRAFLHLQISSTVKLEEGSKDWMHRFSNLNTDSSHLVKHFQHDDTASCRHQNPSTISKHQIFLKSESEAV